MPRTISRIIVLLGLLLVSPAMAQFAIFQTTSTPNTPPVADVVCNLSTGVFTGLGGGTCATTTTTCSSGDNAAAFNSFNTWALTFQAAHPGVLIQLNTPVGTCQFISGTSTINSFTCGIKRFQLVGYGTVLADNAGTGGGFALGCGGVRFDNTHSARFATITAGATSITLLDTTQCSLFANDDMTLLAGIDPQGFGDPPNPQIFEYIQINSVASCAGSGAITLKTATKHGYKSTWPVYFAGTAFVSDQGGPATAYSLNQNWNVTQAFYGLDFDQRAAHTNVNGRSMSLYDVSVTNTGFGPIPSQNVSFSIYNGNFTPVSTEVDKIVEAVTYTNFTVRRIVFQSAGTTLFTCNNCTVSPVGISGTAAVSVLSGGTIAELQLGATSYGASGSFSATNTVISSLVLGGANQGNIDTRGVWASGTLTVPPNMTISSAANNGSGLIRLTVTSTAGWTTGITGDGPTNTDCAVTAAVTVIDATHVDLQGSTFVGTCTGAFGSLPLTWAVPGANVYFGSHYFPLGPTLQVADLAVGANNATVISFNQNGSPYVGGLPVFPIVTSASITAHPSPYWSCIGCTGYFKVADITGPAAAGLPFGSYASRVVTAGNSNVGPMPIFGALTELDVTVTAACGAASSFIWDPVAFLTTLGSSSVGSWSWTINGAVANATARKIFPTTSSGAQSGDTLTPPGAGTWLVFDQQNPKYGTVGNCGSASTTVIIQTNQGVVYSPP